PNNLTSVYQMNITSGTFYVEAYDNSTGRFQMQNRVGMRYYFSNNLDYVTSYGRTATGGITDCSNDKYTVFGDYWNAEGGDSPAAGFEWHGFGDGLGVRVPNPEIPIDSLRGKVVRLEVYYNVPPGEVAPWWNRNVISMDFYWKNVTDGVEYSRTG